MALSVVQTTGQDAFQSGTVAFTLTSSPTVGNLLVAFCAYSQYANSRTITTPTGWTKIDDNTGSSTSSNLDSLAVFWKVVAGGDGTSYSFSISDAGDNTSGVLYEITGANTTTPINQHPHAAALGPVTTIASPSATPSVVGCLAIIAMTLDNAGDVDGFGSVSTGWTEKFTGDSSYHAIFSASKNALTADTTTAISGSFTITSSQSADGGIIETVLIAPSGGSTYTNLFFAAVRP